MIKFRSLVELWNQWLLYGEDSSSMISFNVSVCIYNPNTDVMVFILISQQKLRFELKEKVKRVQQFQDIEGAPLNMSLCKSRAKIWTTWMLKLVIGYSLNITNSRRKRRNSFQDEKQRKLKFFKFRKQLSTHRSNLDNLNIQFSACYHILWTLFKVLLTSETFFCS